MHQRRAEVKAPKDSDISTVMGMNYLQQVVLSSSVNTRNFIENLCHELVHESSYKSYLIDDTQSEIKYFNYREGFLSYNPAENYDEPFWRAFNEAMTELVSSEVVERFVKNNFKTLQQFIPVGMIKKFGSKIVYADSVAIVLDICRKIAEQENKSEGEIFLEFQKSMLTGNDNTFSLIKETFGEKGLEMIKVMQNNPESTLQVAHNLGLQYAEQAIKRQAPLIPINLKEEN